MNQKLGLYFYLMIIVMLSVSCNSEAEGDFDLLEGTYNGMIHNPGSNGSLGSQLEVTIIKTFQTKFTFYLVFKGSSNVIEIPGVEFISEADKIKYDKQDVDSDYEIEGNFTKDGSTGEITVKTGNAEQKGIISRE